MKLIANAGYYLHRKGSDDYTPITSACPPASEADQWEQLPIADIEARREEAKRDAAYRAEVEARIALRYTTSQELAILRQRDTKPEEFAAYDAYAEQCKAAVRAAMESAE